MFLSSLDGIGVLLFWGAIILVGGLVFSSVAYVFALWKNPQKKRSISRDTPGSLTRTFEENSRHETPSFNFFNGAKWFVSIVFFYGFMQLIFSAIRYYGNIAG